MVEYTELNDKEQEIILAVLSLCAPTGRNSEAWKLFERLRDEWAKEPGTDVVMHYAHTFIKGACEAGMVAMVH